MKKEKNRTECSSLGIDDYPVAGDNVLSAFQKTADIFVPEEQDYLAVRDAKSNSATLKKSKYKKANDDLKGFLNAGENGLVEAMISIWNINQYG